MATRRSELISSSWREALPSALFSTTFFYFTGLLLSCAAGTVLECIDVDEVTGRETSVLRRMLYFSPIPTVWVISIEQADDRNVSLLSPGSVFGRKEYHVLLVNSLRIRRV